MARMVASEESMPSHPRHDLRRCWLLLSAFFFFLSSFFLLPFAGSAQTVPGFRPLDPR
jgi:hypothetical protein